jgi:hypothetical protein
MWFSHLVVRRPLGLLRVVSIQLGTGCIWGQMVACTHRTVGGAGTLFAFCSQRAGSPHVGGGQESTGTTRQQ